MSTRFVLATAAELRPDLSLPEGKNPKARKAALRTVVSNMTLNNPEMLKLFPEILRCMRSPDSEVKRMCFLYLETYIKSKPQHIGESMIQLSREVANPDVPPAIRGVALRTLSSIPIKAFALQAMERIPEALRSPDVYLRKTACFAVAKVWALVPAELENSGLLGRLNQMLVKEGSPIVVAAAVQSLLSITDSTPRLQFIVDSAVAQRLAAFLADCPEFAQVSILTALMRFVPQSSEIADALIATILPGLRHANSAVSMGTARVLLMLAHYASEAQNEYVPEQVMARLLSQLNRPPEIEYTVLRNIYLLLQTMDSSAVQRARIAPQTFYFRASDLPFIRSTKIDILVQLCTARTAESIVSELGEFVQLKTDITSRKRAILALGKIGIRFETAVPSCLAKLAGVIGKEPEAIIALVDLARRYPGDTNVVQFARKHIMKTPPPHDEDARRAYFWIVATLTAREDDGATAVDLFTTALQGFTQESPAVQLLLLSGCVKLYLKFPDLAQTVLIPAVFEIATQNSLDPDVRDRAYIYWRLLRASPTRAASIVGQSLTPIAAQISSLDANQLEDLELSLGYISSLYLKPGEQLFRQAQTRQLAASPALRPRNHNAASTPMGSSRTEGPANGPLPPPPLVSSNLPSTLPSTFSPTLASPSPTQSNFPLQATLGQPQHSSYSNPADSSTLLDTYNNAPKPPAPRPIMRRQSTSVDGLHNLSLEATPTGDQSVRLIDI